MKGQVRVDCATSCVITCANMNTLQVCTESCQLNGCQCPQGSVINEEINTCVRPSDCNSTTGIIIDLTYIIRCLFLFIATYVS